MSHGRTATGLLLLACLAWPAPAPAQGLVITEAVEQTHRIDLADIEKLPAIDLQVSFQTSHGPQQANYTGALLWTLLKGAEPAGGGADPKMHTRQTIAVTGRDGYVAVLARAEIDPEFEGKKVIVAYRKDGQQLNGGELRLVVPGDHRGGRSVQDILRIEVR